MKSLFDKEEFLKRKSNTRPPELEELYERTQETVFHEAQVLWQTSAVFLTANTILFGFIASQIFSNYNQQLLVKTNYGLMTISILGLIICFIWFVSSRRIGHYYRFRIAQARQREPEGWNLYSGDGQNFSEGSRIKIDDEVHSLEFGRLLKNNDIPAYVICLFVVCYILVVLITGPWIR